jgi:hypothetical protein
VNLLQRLQKVMLLSQLKMVQQLLHMSKPPLLLNPRRNSVAFKCSFEVGETSPMKKELLFERMFLVDLATCIMF